MVARNLRKVGIVCVIFTLSLTYSIGFCVFVSIWRVCLISVCGKVISFLTVVNYGFRLSLVNWIFFGISIRIGLGRFE